MTEPDKIPEIDTGTPEPEVMDVSPVDKYAEGFNEDTENDSLPGDDADIPPGDAEPPEKDEKESDEAKDELDPAKTRAEELLAEQALLKERSEKIERELAEENKRVAMEKALAEKSPITDETITGLSSVLSWEELPETVMIDGEPVEIREFAKNAPEVQVVAGVMAQRQIEHMQKTGEIVTPSQMKEQLDKIDGYYFGRLHELQIENRVHQKYSVDIHEVVESAEWKEWAAKASEADKALLNSTPADFVLGFGNFMKTQKPAENSAEKEEAVAKARAKKKAHDALNAGGVKSTGGGPTGALTSGDADAERAKGFDSFD